MKALKLVTVAELPAFLSQVGFVLNHAERGAFIAYIAEHPEAGDEIPEQVGFVKYVGVVRARIKREEPE